MNVELNKQIAKEILANNIRREYKIFSKYACNSRSSIRFRDEAIPDNHNIRPAFFHDTDKIIHSLAYTRYIDKTQVFYLFENDHITHRVLHVQLVSKIARVIGRALSLNEDLIEAISLGHDLGHVPYGHNGEKKLNEITYNKIKEYFCHNAQSVRALEYIEKDGKGLNLTLQVKDGILCHNGESLSKEYKPDYKKTAKQFEEEYNLCWTKENYSKKIISMTLEGCVMRISDIIAYIGRDLEDAITIKLINREDIPKEIRDTLGDNNSDIINNFILDIINNSYGQDSIRLSNNIYEGISKFYEFSSQNIYNNPKKITQDDKINKMFDVLFDLYLTDLKSGNLKTSISKFINLDFRNKYSNERIVCDYIAGMTDDYFNNEFKNAILPKSFGYEI